ncbi:MAG: hypothetical protein RMI00_06575 [Sulfolobales archaeon]|nr:hypothetical protein [Sulfolobales archaeon]
MRIALVILLGLLVTKVADSSPLVEEADVGRHVFRMETLGGDFYCTAFAVEEKVGVTAGHCVLFGIVVRVSPYTLYTTSSFKAEALGPGRDKAVFWFGYLRRGLPLYEGPLQHGDKLYTEGYPAGVRLAMVCDYDAATTAFFSAVLRVETVGVMRCPHELRGGASGSPIVKGGRVVGVLTHYISDERNVALFTRLSNKDLEEVQRE